LLVNSIAQFSTMKDKYRIFIDQTKIKGNAT